MEYQIETIGEITVVRLKGSFDKTSRGRMEIELLSLVSYGNNLIFDLSEVDFISSAGLHFLLDFYRHCEQRGARLAVTAPSDQVREILQMTGFTTSGFPVYDTFEDGLSALRAKMSYGGSSRGFDEGAASAPETSYDIPKMEEKEEVNFSAFYPREVTVEKWYTLLVYTYVPSALEAVRKDASKFEDEIGEIHETKPVSSTQLARGTQVTVVPSCEGVTFNPERVTFQWLEDQHRAQFRLRADASMVDMAGNAQVTIYIGPLIVGTLKMGMLFNAAEANLSFVRSAEVNSQIYHQEDIFVSYSHLDTDIVKTCKKAYEALGHNVLIDFETLRSGQKWNAELMRMIERANIFQLFWSENSSKSEYCRQEWQHALKLNRGEGFIRPVYWKEPLPQPPPELSEIHFDFAPFSV
jgi:anti-sigma B factor antagonist